jgi:hypothetical protein
MTDWNEIRENIARATQASTQFNEIGEVMVKAPEQVNIREFAARVVALQKELQDILTLIGSGSPVALDEITDAFSQAIHGHPTTYRMTPQPPSKGK